MKYESRTGEKILNVLFVVMIIAIIGGLFYFFIGRDEKVAEAAQSYEQCVKVEFNTTPGEWYAIHGSYPECAQ